MQLIYLAGPIDGVSEQSAGDWRKEASELATKYGFGTFNPYKAYSLPTCEDYFMEVAPLVDAINRDAIELSDYFLLNLTGEGKAVGSIRELEHATTLNKTVVVVNGDFVKRIAFHDVEVFDDLHGALAFIAEEEGKRRDRSV